MTQRIEGKKIQIITAHEMVDEIDKISKDVGITRSDFIRICVRIGLESYNDGTLQFGEQIVKLERNQI